MILAARSAFMRNGIRKRFFAVIAVTMNPGLMIETPTPYGASSARLASRNVCIAALLAE
mgnify:CR=1 FL=1